MNLATINKALIAGGTLVVAVLSLAGVHASTTVDTLVGIALTLTPLGVYLVKNQGQVDLPFANKAIATLGAAVVGVCMIFHVDVSEQVKQVSMAATALTPLVVFFLHNGPSLSGKL